jgi:signal transduction histidine kinase/HPt (histidine-containing phosphotransfer) domain-containing protein/ActR/RegA family two-component response regulator
MLNSIKAKMILSMVMGILVTIGVLSIIIIQQQQNAAKVQTEQSLIILADVVADNIQAALMFADTGAAQHTLLALKAREDIESAELFDATGSIFVRYSKSLDEALDKPLGQESITVSQMTEQRISYDQQGLHSYTPVMSGDELLGVLHITDNMGSLTEQVNQFYNVVFTAAVAAIIAALGILFWIQNMVSKPLTLLLSVIQKIIKVKDYSQRVDIKTGDEFEVLANNFNNMVAEVERRGAQLENINKNLEKRVAERTNDLQEALEMTNKASKAKSEFLAVMSHEIRTPLNGVIGFAEVLKTHDFGDVLNEQVRLLNSSAKTLLELLTEILDFSKLDSGQLELDAHQFELSSLVKTTLELHESNARHKGITLNCNEFKLDHDYFIGDSVRLKQILNNLISNAIKFTPDGSVSLHVSSDAIGSEWNLNFEVTDTGIGLEQSKLHDIFSPFTQADGSITREYGGKGLGLSICRQLCDLMGGKMGVNSEKGIGSTFWFTAPLAPMMGIYEVVETEARQVETILPKASILVAEDNPVNQLVVRSLLASLKQDCDIVNNGEEALARATTKKYNLIFMDYHMPVMDGLIATEKIRELGVGSINYSTPIIALTADIQKTVRRKFRRAGGSDIVLKPFTRQTLNNCLNQWLFKKLEKTDLPKNAVCVKNNETILATQQLDEIADMASDSGSTLVKSVVDLYLEHTPGLIQQIKKALSERNAESLFKAAHSLKSSSANIGALRLSALASQFEQNGREGDVDSAEKMIEELDDILQQTLLAINEKMKEYIE